MLLNRLTILYCALLWNILHVALENPVLINEPKHLYYEEFFPQLYWCWGKLGWRDSNMKNITGIPLRDWSPTCWSLATFGLLVWALTRSELRNMSSLRRKYTGRLRWTKTKRNEIDEINISISNKGIRGRIVLDYLEGRNLYVCSACGTHLTTHKDLLSRVWLCICLW